MNTAFHSGGLIKPVSFSAARGPARTPEQALARLRGVVPHKVKVQETFFDHPQNPGGICANVAVRFIKPSATSTPAVMIAPVDKQGLQQVTIRYQDEGFLPFSFAFKVFPPAPSRLIDPMLLMGQDTHTPIYPTDDQTAALLRIVRAVLASA